MGRVILYIIQGFRLTRKAEMMVVTDAPIKPSHVFFGDNLINGVLPRKNPNKYAAMSLITMSEAGRRNLCKHRIEDVWSL
jgi:hypothetical protein